MDELLSIAELLPKLGTYNYTAIHVHHTWKPDHSNFTGSNHQQLQDGMRSYHMNNLGWSDIGQHVTLFPDGKFMTGRDFHRTPASIKNYNTGAFAVEMLGNFDLHCDALEGPQMDSILRLVKWFKDNGKKVIFHNEKSTKTCPGSSINKESFMKEVDRFSVDDVAEWAEDAWHFGVDQGIISTESVPTAPVTKQEVMTMIYRYHNR